MLFYFSRIEVRESSQTAFFQESKRTNKNITAEEIEFIKFYEDTENLQIAEDAYSHTFDHPGTTIDSPLFSESPTNNDKIDTLILPPELLVDYTTYTLSQMKDRCRERGLQVSGTKALLLSRIQDDVADQTQAIQAHQNHFRPQFSPSVLDQHLEALVTEFITSGGGSVGSRDMGRYLSKCPGANGNTETTALKQLKNAYGSLAHFIGVKSYLFEKFSGNDEQEEFTFTISLR